MVIYNINSKQAYEILDTNRNSYLIDVRTLTEWQQGVPKFNRLKFISWRLEPDMKLNLNFYNEFIKAHRAINNDDIFFFICKAGGRSYEAANFIKNKGVKNCYNIIDGYEGNQNEMGWRNNNLPCQTI